MVKFIIKPNIGIGEVNLGMTREEVHKVMGSDFFSFERDAKITDCFCSQHFRVSYSKNNKVEFIEIARFYVDNYQIIFEEVDVFKTRAEELVSYIERFAQYDKDDVDSQLGLAYVFKDIGLSLWRPNVFEEKTLQEPWFQALGQEEKDAELRYRYFEAVGLGCKGYWD